MIEEGQHTYRGLIMGPNGDVNIARITGLDGYDQLRTSTIPIPRGHGGIAGQHYAPPRTIVYDLEAWGEPDELQAIRQKLADALTPQVEPEDRSLTFRRPGQPERLVYCRPIELLWPIDIRRTGLTALPKVAFEASDPRIYSAAGKKATLSPFTTTGGVNDPVEDPKDATVSGADVAVTNDGNVGAPVVARFYGPTSGTCTGVQLTNRTTGVTLDVQTNIVADQILTVDMRAFVAATGARVVDLSGSGRYGAWQQTREALLIEPGSNLLRFTADGTTTGMQCRVDFADAWIS